MHGRMLDLEIYKMDSCEKKCLHREIEPKLLAAELSTDKSKNIDIFAITFGLTQCLLFMRTYIWYTIGVT